MKNLSIILLFLLFFITNNQVNAQIGGLVKSKIKSNKSKKEKTVENKETKIEDNTSVPSETKPEVEESTTPTPSDVSNDGITSDYHKKNLGKIVFSKSGIDKGKEEQAILTNTFKLGEEEIHFRVYMDNSLSNYIQRISPNESRYIQDVHSRYIIRFTLDNEKIYEGKTPQEYFRGDEKRQWTTFRGSFYRNKKSDLIGMDDFRHLIMKSGDKLSNGKHSLKIEFLPYIDYREEKTGDVVASGEIEIIVDEHSIDPKNENMCVPKAVMINKELEAKVKEAYSKKGGEEKAGEVRIISDQWKVVRNGFGVVLKRHMRAVITLESANNCYYQVIGFAQDHDGNNYQEKVYINEVLGKYEIPCNCLR